MSKVNKIRDDIRSKIGATGRRALVVEGVDDVAALRIWLNRQAPNWESDWALEEARGKENVLAIARLEPDWLGLIDSDGEAPAELSSRRGTINNFQVLPRFCIENYACVPTEIWQAVQAMPQRVHLNFNQFESEVVIGLPNWRRYAALWRAVNPLWGRLMDKGFNNALLDPDEIRDDESVRQTLNGWAEVLGPEPVFADFQTQHLRLQAIPQDEFLRTAVHGKYFYLRAVHSVLNRWLGQADENTRQRQLFQNMPVPADLAPLWLAMNL